MFDKIHFPTALLQPHCHVMTQTYGVVLKLNQDKLSNNTQNTPPMNQSTINERIKFLIESMGLSVRAFSSSIGVAYTTTRNYTDRGTNPKAEYITKILSQFSNINPNWLYTGEGEPFLSTDPQTISTAPNAKKISRSQLQAIRNNYGTATNRGNSKGNETDYQKELEAAQLKIASLEREIESFKSLVAAKNDVIASKDETINLLRANYIRPN